MGLAEQAIGMLALGYWLLAMPDELQANSASQKDGLAPPSKEQGKTSFSVRGQRVTCD